MLPTTATRRARYLRARRLHARWARGLTREAKIKGFFRRCLELITTPLVWLLAAFQVFLRWVDRRFTTKSTVQIPWDAHRTFLIVGHRGSPTKKVENTIPSFDEALDVDGANAIETDFCVTKDGEVVVWHDWDPDGLVAFARQLGAEPGQKYRPWVPPPKHPMRRPTTELLLAELRAHYGYALARGRRAVQAEIITMSELMKWAAKKPNLKALLLDMKVPRSALSLVPRIVEVTRAAIATHRPSCEMIVLSPEAEVAAEFRRLAPEWSVSCDVELPAGRVKNPSQHSALERARALKNDRASVGRPPLTFQGWRVFRGIVESDLTAWAQSQLDPVAAVASKGYVCWTINSRQEQRQLLDMGVHAMLTDRPKQLRRLAVSRNRPL